MSPALWIDRSGGTRSSCGVALTVESCPIRGIIKQASTPEIDRGEVGISWNLRQVAVRLCLDRVTAPALAAALNRLEDSRREAVLIYRYRGAWTGERVAGGVPAAERLSAIHAARAVAHVPLFQTELPLSALEAKGANPLLRLGLEFWRRGAGVFDESLPGFDWLLMRSQLSVPVAGRCATRFVFVGPESSAAVVWGRRWCTKEAPFSNSVPDQDFDARVVGIYDRVRQDGEPRLHRLLALIRKYDGEFAWVPYHRLLLPLRFANGAPVFNCLVTFAPSRGNELLSVPA